MEQDLATLFDRQFTGGFERPYGWRWLLKLPAGSPR